VRNALYARLAFERFGSCSGAYFAGAVDAAAGGAPALLMLAPARDALAAHYHAPVAVHAGAVRVSQLLRQLGRAGLRADIVGGGLVTAGGIVIRRPPREDAAAAAETAATHAGDPPPALLLEGPLSADYYRARAAVLGAFKAL